MTAQNSFNEFHENTWQLYKLFRRTLLLNFTKTHNSTNDCTEIFYRISRKLMTTRQIISQNSFTEFHENSRQLDKWLHRTLLPNFTKTHDNSTNDCTEFFYRISRKLTTRQIIAQNSFTEFHENPTNRLVADTRPMTYNTWTWCLCLHKTFFFSLRKERPKNQAT